MLKKKYSVWKEMKQSHSREAGIFHPCFPKKITLFASVISTGIPV
jgi:hypothetical protein